VVKGITFVNLKDAGDPVELAERKSACKLLAVLGPAATCDYTLPFTAVLEHENVYGVQFHSEKSGPLGLLLVRNFIEQC